MRKGAGLIELLVAIFISAVLLLAGATSFHRMEPRYRLQAAVWAVVSQMNHARFLAILDDTPVRVRFSPGSCTLEEWDEDLSVWKQSSLTEVEGTVLSANNEPVFHPEGTVSNLATIGVTNSQGGFKITLAITGRVKVAKA